MCKAGKSLSWMFLKNLTRFQVRKQHKEGQLLKFKIIQ